MSSASVLTFSSGLAISASGLKPTIATLAKSSSGL